MTRARVRFLAEWVAQWEPETAPTDKTEQSEHPTFESAAAAARSNAKRCAVIPWCYVREQRKHRDGYWQTVARWVGDYDGMEAVLD